MRASYRKALVFTILGGVVAAVMLGPERNKPSAPFAAPPSRAAHAEATTSAPESKGTTSSAPLSLPERPALSEPPGALFGAQSWQPPPPKVAAPPPPPSAPPMPYRFAGRVLHGGKLQVFLSKGGRAIPISEGEILDGAYRVESIATDRITLVYLPLDHRETIAARATTEQLESKPARLFWEGPQQVKLGTSFSVALHVISDEPVRASPMQVRFDPTVLESVAVQPGKFYGAEAGGGFIYRIRPDGTILIGASNHGPAPASNAELLVLTFKPIKPTSIAELSIASLTLQGTAGQAIPMDALNAFRTAVTP